MDNGIDDVRPTLSVGHYSLKKSPHGEALMNDLVRWRTHTKTPTEAHKDPANQLTGERAVAPIFSLRITQRDLKQHHAESAFMIVS